MKIAILGSGIAGLSAARADMPAFGNLTMAHNISLPKMRILKAKLKPLFRQALLRSGPPKAFICRTAK